MVGKLIRTDDWEALYINDNLIDEDHWLNSPNDWINWTNKYNLEKVEIYEVRKEDVYELESSGSFPMSLKELKGNYN